MITNNKKVQYRCYECGHIGNSPDKCKICGSNKLQKMTVVINK